MYEIDSYNEFLSKKRVSDPPTGIEGAKKLNASLFPFQRDIVRWALRRGRAALFAGTGLGKALRFDWPVATPDGWRPISELAIGDSVIGSNGRAITVTGVYEQGVRPLVQVTFTDGATTICDEDHLWSVNTKGRRHRGLPWRVLTTKQIVAEGLDDQEGRRHFIPVCDPVEYPARELPIDPYTLGVLIGDGALSQNSISITTDKAIIDHLKFPDGVRALISNDNGIFVSAYISQGRNGGHAPNPIRTALNVLGFEGSKSGDKRYYVALATKFPSADRHLIPKGVSE